MIRCATKVAFSGMLPATLHRKAEAAAYRSAPGSR